MSVKIKNSNGTWSQVGGMQKPGFQDISGQPTDNANLATALNSKSSVSVSDTGTATDTVSYITVNGVEKKLAGGGGGGGNVNDVKVSTDGSTYTSVVDGAGIAKIDLSDYYELPADGIPSTDMTEAVQTLLGKANTAVQDISGGSDNGTIAVDGINVEVTGLDSAAFTPTTNYATAAQGAKADAISGSETWTFTLADSTVVTKKVLLSV